MDQNNHYLEFLARTRLKDREPAMVRKVYFKDGVCQDGTIAFHVGEVNRGILDPAQTLEVKRQVSFPRYCFFAVSVRTSADFIHPTRPF